MKQYKPDMSREAIDKLWKSNKNNFQDLLMDTIQLHGGDLLNDEHYFNVFKVTGGYMINGGTNVSIGVGGKFDRTKYDKINNPYGIGKTHSDDKIIKPKMVEPKLATTTDPIEAPSDRRGNMSLLRGRDPTLDRPDNTDLSDPASWTRAIGDIATMTYDTVADVFDFFL